MGSRDRELSICSGRRGVAKIPDEPMVSPRPVRPHRRPDPIGGMGQQSWVRPLKRVIPNDLVAAAAAVGSEMAYKVEADCRMSISGTVANPTGSIDLNLLGGLADGGSEALLQSGSPVFIGAWTAKRADSSAAAAEAGSMQADAIKALLDRMAVRLSVLP